MDISIFLKPSSVRPQTSGEGEVLNDTIGKSIVSYSDVTDEELTQFKLAIIGVCEDRAAPSNQGSAKAPDAIREALFALSCGQQELKILDLGNVLPGESIIDTYFALTQIVFELNRKKIIPLVLGGSQDLTFALYRAYEKLEQTVNIVTVDRKFDLGEISDDISSENYFTKIILHQPNYLFNYTNIATQSHFADHKTLAFIEKLYFDQYRLGELRKDIQAAEPLIRNADIFSFDMGAIRAADAPANAFVSPNGLFGEEACQLMRYAGMCDKISSVGIFEVNPAISDRGQTAALAAQMIWYFIDGYYSRKHDFPHLEKTTYLKYRVNSDKLKGEVIFYKSPKSDRWWMEVPYPPDKRLKFERHHLVPCTYSDYELACNEELPDLWWRTYHKLC